MKTLHAGLLVAVLFAIAAVAVTNAQSATPYKLGMFQQGTRSFVGMVIQNDTVVLDLSRANVGAPGDMISSGSPAGVGTARGTPIYFKDGDTSTCTIASIGTLENPVRAEK